MLSSQAIRKESQEAGNFAGHDSFQAVYQASRNLTLWLVLRFEKVWVMD
jgi:hypothetical protein